MLNGGATMSNELMHFQDRRQKRGLSESEIQAIAAAVVQACRDETHTCRFADIEPDELKEALKFIKSVNDINRETKRIIWKTVVTIGVCGFITIVVVGIVVKIKELLTMNNIPTITP